ncbi:ATP-binding cassette domain-containing protein [Propionibacterium australiense]|uniref:ATP-binding cassette domain-containing protein n=1 Tax=Propionibacterium australiense TaxID=119981 RepID=A0A8B3FR77_9ACTN|nr:ATP-binding cassette domain-containing protein [Propionibacterium australiense]
MSSKETSSEANKSPLTTSDPVVEDDLARSGGPDRGEDGFTGGAGEVATAAQVGDRVRGGCSGGDSGRAPARPKGQGGAGPAVDLADGGVDHGEVASGDGPAAEHGSVTADQAGVRGSAEPAGEVSCDAADPPGEGNQEGHADEAGGEDEYDIADAAANKARAAAGGAAIKRLGAPVRGRLLVGQVLVVISGILAVAPYIALVRLGELLLAAHREGRSPDPQQVRAVVLVLVAAYTARLGLHFVALMITHFADLVLRDRLRRDIVERIARAPLSWFTDSTSGQVRKAIQDDTTAVHVAIAHGPVDRLNAAVSPLALLACALWIDWRLALLAIATIPLYAFTYSLSMRGMTEKTIEMDRRLATVSATMTEFVAGISVVKAFGRVGRAHDAYLKAADGFSGAYRSWAMPLITVSCLASAWVSIPVLLLVNLGGGALLLHAGLVTMPQVLACTLIALVLPGTLDAVMTISFHYQLAGAAALRLCEILDTPVLPAPDEPRSPEGARVEIDHVTYSYGDTLAVEDANLVLEPGTVTALLGPSGSGKTTLATLIARFADPDEGSVRIGGVDVRAMDEDTLYRNVSFVLQDPQLLAASIAENIALGRPDATREQIRAAARAARIDEEIMALPDGYDTVLGRDTALSGGQEQRIAIARAILLDTPVLLLDEATAMVDPESESQIQQALSELVRDRTVLVIAHRPAAVRGAHQIVVMDYGRITATGTHDELGTDPHYQTLLRQSGQTDGAAVAAAVGERSPDDEETSTADEEPIAQNAVAAGNADPARRHGEQDTGPGLLARSAGVSLLHGFRRLTSPLSWRKTVTGLWLGVAYGTFCGLALLFLMPASTALVTGEARWGLSFGGWLIALAACTLMAAVTDFMGRRLGMVGALGFMHDVHHAVGDKIARLPLRWFTADTAGVMSRAVTKEMVDLAQSAAHFLYEIVAKTAGCVVIWLGSWLWDWRLGALLTAAVPVLVVLLRVSQRLIGRGKATSEPAERELAVRIVELTRCQGALRACHAASGYGRLVRAFDDGIVALRRAMWWEASGGLLSGVLTQVIVVAMIALTASLASSGAMAALPAVATIGMSLRFTTMLNDIGSGMIGVEDRRELMKHLDAVMDAQVQPEPSSAAALPTPGEVEFDDVVFGYRPGEPVLRGISLDMPARTMCAIVGPSGSGKTTIVRLLARFWDVDGGSVRVGGVDVREMPTAQLMGQVSMVFQDVYLFDDTLEANIRVGRSGASDEEVRWAAELAGVTEITKRLPGGWEARVGEGGRALSGGERQRVSIARALLKRAPIVLLDEATSALDAENETNIVAAMEQLRRTSTLVVIAHKLETVTAADQVVVLGVDGRVAQRGRHDELVDVPGPYQAFWRQRTQAAGWTLV